MDFQQLKIENAQFLEKIDERNQELLQLKLTVGSSLQVLSFYKVNGVGPPPVLPRTPWEGAAPSQPTPGLQMDPVGERAPLDGGRGTSKGAPFFHQRFRGSKCWKETAPSTSTTHTPGGFF